MSFIVQYRIAIFLSIAIRILFRDIRVTHYLYIYHNCLEKSYATHIILLIINDTLSKCRLSYNIIAIFFSIAIYQNYYFENKRGEQRTLFHGSRRDEGV